MVEFLTHLLRHIPGKGLVIWDGATTHRSKIVRDFVAEQNGGWRWSVSRVMRPS